jgi:hypothetical protein
MADWVIVSGKVDVGGVERELAMAEVEESSVDKGDGSGGRWECYSALTAVDVSFARPVILYNLAAYKYPRRCAVPRRA